MREKQNKNINIRVSEELRDKFVSVARTNNDNYSELIRDYMKEYIDKYDR